MTDHCAKCGRAVYYREVGTVIQTGQPARRWCARKGGKYVPVDCPRGGYHIVDAPFRVTGA